MTDENPIAMSSSAQPGTVRRTAYVAATDFVLSVGQAAGLRGRWPRPNGIWRAISMAFLGRRTTGSWAGFVLVMVGAAGAAPALATVMVEIPLEDLAREADVIVHGIVLRSDARVVQQGSHTEPHTITTLAVVDWIRGGPGETVTIEELGGRWQGGGMRVDGTPTYQPGEEVVAFLDHLEGTSTRFRTHGMVQGKFTVLRGVPGVPSSVRRDVGAISFARWTGSQMTLDRPGTEAAMELTLFVDFVRRAASHNPGAEP